MAYEEYNTLTTKIIGCSIDVHKALGPGLLESAYQKCLRYELISNGLSVREELSMPITYKELKIDYGYRIDLLVENKVVLELKVVDHLRRVHEAQVLTYLNLGDFPIGYLLNFNESLLKDGIRRFVI